MKRNSERLGAASRQGVKVLPIGVRIRNAICVMERDELEDIIIEIAEDALMDTDAEVQDVDGILEDHGIPTAARESF